MLIYYIYFKDYDSTISKIVDNYEQYNNPSNIFELLKYFLLMFAMILLFILFPIIMLIDIIIIPIELIIAIIKITRNGYLE